MYHICVVVACQSLTHNNNKEYDTLWTVFIFTVFILNPLPFIHAIHFLSGENTCETRFLSATGVQVRLFTCHALGLQLRSSAGVTTEELTSCLTVQPLQASLSPPGHPSAAPNELPSYPGTVGEGVQKTFKKHTGINSRHQPI